MIFKIIAEVSDRRSRGEILPDAAVIESHADLMPELSSQLAALRSIHRAYLAAQKAGAQQQPAPPATQDPAAQGTDAAAAPATGRTSIQGYAAIEQISAGGQGDVFKAIQESTGRTVAIKVLSGGPFSSSRQRARFDREADILAGLDHPNIVRIIDRGRTADGSLFIVMSYVEGWSLDDYVSQCRAEGAVGMNRLVRLFADIARAAHEAHRHGVVHRDLKPSNIRVDREGRPHILDFGLARLTAASETQFRTVTETGQIVGSLPWASPEQVSRDIESLDARSDVYSLGVMLYRALTDRSPYQVHGPLREVIDSILKSMPAPPGLADAMGENADGRALDAIVLKALAKSSAERYATALQFAEDLESYLAGSATIAARHRTRRARLRLYRMAAASMCICLTGMILVHFTRQPVLVPEKLERCVNTFQMEFVKIPRGSFTMGSPTWESGHEADEQQHDVTLTKPFWMGLTEVTQGQYAAVMGPEADRMLQKQAMRGSDLPVHNISWDQATEFCRRLSEKEGERYRLPTEAEWEYACRAGADGPFGGVGKLDRMGWYSGNSKYLFQPVARKQPNRWGLFDMHGGVAEWCVDEYNMEWPVGTVDPVRQGIEGTHVARGGSSRRPQEECRSASRRYASDNVADVGFRVVREVAKGG